MINVDALILGKIIIVCGMKMFVEFMVVVTICDRHIGNNQFNDQHKYMRQWWRRWAVEMTLDIEITQIMRWWWWGRRTWVCSFLHFSRFHQSTSNEVEKWYGNYHRLGKASLKGCQKFYDNIDWEIISAFHILFSQGHPAW